ncbi:MAG TPA: glycerol-3-phosphate dehydrogenase [Gammaproteobacteria bacterium]|jgi:glycerol-3-phosphate dehydrogenase (NAD(P)+)|nr:glycerol-3-phosphate dehydrogenase [Gammaproteobacteria bacterium]
MADSPTLLVMGAGSWGTALASLLARNGHPTVLWGRSADAMQAMRDAKENARYLPGLPLPDCLQFTSDLQPALASCEGVLLGVPTNAFSSTLDVLSPTLRDDQTLMWACKGLDSGSGRLLHAIVHERLGEHRPSALISGPTFAAELAANQPTAATVAAFDLNVAERVARWLHGDNFRAYSTDDMVGVEVGGALKNVFAIAAGISDGLGFGSNARAALITRGLAELMRLGVAMGARPETLMGLSGMGDLVLTCTDDQSRNRRFGLCLARGLSVQAALDEIAQVVEGVKTTGDAQKLAQQYGVEMPIVQEVHAVIADGKSPRAAVRDLLSRTPKQET